MKNEEWFSVIDVMLSCTEITVTLMTDPFKHLLEHTLVLSLSQSFHMI